MIQIKMEDGVQESRAITKDPREDLEMVRQGGAGEGADMSRGDYQALFSGRLYGILQWDRFGRIWRYLEDEPEGWYVRDFRKAALPESPMPADAFRVWLAETENFLRRRHREDYCGFLYVDDQEAPTFLKIFDPRKMGTSCGCSGGIEPRWTVSRMPPAREETATGESDAATEQSRGASLLKQLFGRRVSAFL